MTDLQKKDELPAKSDWRSLPVGFAVWTFLALLTASRNYLTYQQLKLDVPVRITLLSAFTDYYLWALASILIFKLCRRYPIEVPRIFQNLVIHFVSSVVFMFLIALISIPIFALVSGDAEVTASLTNLPELSQSIVFRPSNLYQGFITYWATVAVAHAVAYYRKSHEKELRLQTIAAQLAEAKLSALKMQIHPHFLFNTLNSISALLHRDIDKAEQMISYLADFLRMTLASSDSNETALKNEIRFLETYLKIEKIRFSDRLKVKFDIAPETLSATVPTLITQPLVENAIKHGFGDKSDECVLEISTSKIAQDLEITIKDNGRGISKNSAEIIGNGGVGLKNANLRLKEFYKNDFEFEVKNGNGHGGTIVSIKTPFVNFFESGNGS